MKIGKKLTAILAIALLMFSASSSLVGLNAQDITFTTTDFYLADDKGTKVGSLDITDKSEFALQFIRENSLDRKITIHIPTGIYWDQEQTESGVDPSDVRFEYEGDSNDIIVNYGYDENTNMIKLFFEKTDQFIGDEMMTAETTRDNELLVSEPLYLRQELQDINTDENLVVTDESEEVASINEIGAQEGNSSLSDSDGDLEVSLMHSYGNGEEVKVTLATATFYTDIIVKNKSDKNIENIEINDTVSEHMEAKSGTMEVDGVRMSKDQEIMLWNGAPMGRHGKELTMDVPVLEPGQSTHLHWATWASPIMEGLTYTGFATEKLKVEAEGTEYTDEHTVKLLRDLATPYIETRIKDDDGNEVEGAEVGDVLTFEYTGTLNTTIMGIFDTYYLEVLPDYLEYQPNTTYIEGNRVEDDSVWEGNKFEFFKDYQVPGEYLVIEFKVLVKGLSPAETLYSKMITQKENGMKKKLWQKEFLLRQNSSENPRISAENKVTNTDGHEVTEAKVGETIYYKVRGTNNAGILFGNEVILRDKLPDYLEYQPGSTIINGTAVDDNMFWDGNTLEVMADLLPGSSIEAEFAVKVLGTETIEDENFIINSVTTGSKDDDDPSVAEVRLKEAQEPEEDKESLALDQVVLDANGESINGQEVESGEELHYQITAVNDGNTIIKNPIVKDTLVNGLDLKEHSTILDGEDIEDEVVWSGKSLQLVANELEPGDKMTVNFTVIVNDDAKELVENTGFVGIGDDSTLRSIKDLKPTPTVMNSIKDSTDEEDGEIVDEGNSENNNSEDPDGDSQETDIDEENTDGDSQETDIDEENTEKKSGEKEDEDKGELPKTGSSLGVVATITGIIFSLMALLTKRLVR